MAYKLIKTDSFQRDLDSAIGYIVFSLENRTAAASLLDAVEKSYDGIERMPLMYEACHDPHLKEMDYRKAVIRNYIMVYRVDVKTETVYFMRLFHGRQDYERLIKTYLMEYGKKAFLWGYFCKREIKQRL